ncbi:hypothetical protein RBH20_09800 [Haloarcula sp. H-GB4]|uniref:hypothetical protein n=1 Tax=Haloarcula sp. H-GB4 TaxID=3069755 RepID=UPI0027B3FC86|nr:hypothetical protein [Haloarcula sp. H-GB4]MDQ2072827.1 hypothetical protein [Haloarcula sp. H-GB4]
MTLVVEDAGDEDFTLLVTDDGAVEARKQIPYDGVLRFTTATRALPTGRRTKSQFGLTADTVIDSYLARADTETPRVDLEADVSRARREVCQEGEDA